MKDIWFIYAILLAFPGLILLAVIVKYFEVMKARNWSSVQGIITVSTSEVRTVKTGVGEDADSEKRNFAKIVYEYKIANHTFHGDRVTIGEDLGNCEVAETIAKYPKGKPVTVYYNPNKRTEAVLERDLPPFVWKGALIIIAVLVAMIFGGVIGIEKLSKFMSTIVRNPAEAPFVTGCLAFAFFTALFVYAFQKQASIERRWPVVPGRIESVGVTQFVSHSSDEGRTRDTVMYRPQVVYSYAVAGVTYQGEKISGSSVSSSSETVAKKNAEKYTKGHPVEVHYNPQKSRTVVGRSRHALGMASLDYSRAVRRRSIFYCPLKAAGRRCRVTLDVLERLPMTTRAMTINGERHEVHRHRVRRSHRALEHTSCGR